MLDIFQKASPFSRLIFFMVIINGFTLENGLAVRAF